MQETGAVRFGAWIENLLILLGGLLTLVTFFSVVYFIVFYSSNPPLVSGTATGSSSSRFTDADWEATWEWSTADRLSRANTVVVVTWEKSLLFYHKAILTEVLKISDDDHDLPPIGGEFEYASFRRLDSRDYGDGSVILFYDQLLHPIREEHIHHSGGVLRDDEGTSLRSLREHIKPSFR